MFCFVSRFCFFPWICAEAPFTWSALRAPLPPSLGGPRLTGLTGLRPILLPPATSSASMAPRPPKSQAFDVTVPPSTSVDAVFSAVSAIVSLSQVLIVQWKSSTSYQIVMKSSAAFDTVMSAGQLMFGSTAAPVTPVGPQLIPVSVLYLPGWVSDDALVQAMAPYCKVQSISHATYQDQPTIETGTRRLTVIMKEGNPLPNFLRVAGHMATFDYRGVKRICRRCRQEGHYRAQCTAAYRTRCSLFGHAMETCTVGCRRCQGPHATADCTTPRTYLAAARGDDRRLPPPASADSLPGAVPFPVPSQPPRPLPRPPEPTAPVHEVLDSSSPAEDPSATPVAATDSPVTTPAALAHPPTDVAEPSPAPGVGRPCPTVTLPEGPWPLIPVFGNIYPPPIQ